MELVPTFRETEIGALPSDWAISPLISVAHCLDNLRVPLNESQRQRRRGDVPYCGANGVLDHVDSYVIDDDVILMAEDGGFFDEYESRAIAYRMKGKCWVNNHAHILKAKAGHDQGFLFYSLVHKNILPFLASGTRAKLNKSEMEKILVPVPPTEREQHAIAGALETADALLEALTRNIVKKRDLKQAAMQQLLTGRTRLPAFEVPWRSVRLGDHVQFLRSGAFARADLVDDGNVKYLHYGDIHVSPAVRLNPSLGEMPCLPELRAERLDRLIDGDLVFVDASEDRDGVGKAVEIVNSAGVQLVAGLHTIAARFDKTVIADGFKAYLQYCPPFASHLRRLAAGTKVYATTRAHIASVAMSLPDPEEQNAIATILSDMDAELAALEARLEKTKALKQAMMQELLTGRTRLVAPEPAHA